MRICVAGMHRSGTSLVANVLVKCGVELGPTEEFLEPNAENREGFWENKRFVALNDELLSALGGTWDQPPDLYSGWEDSEKIAPLRERALELISSFDGSEAWGWKDPRNSLTLSFWRQLIPDLKVVVCVRNPIEVADSLARRGLDEKRALDLWLLYNQAVLRAAVDTERIVAEYDSFFHGGDAAVRRLVGRLGLVSSDLQIAHAAAAVNEYVRHHRASASEGLSQNVLPAAVAECYAELATAAAEPGSGSSGLETTLRPGRCRYTDYDDSPGSTHNLVVYSVPAGANVLEIGCATGYMSAVLKERCGATVTGVEISPSAAAVARMRCDRVVVGDAETLDFAATFGAERFDAIVMADVLEHLREPARILERIRGLLSDDGRIVASVPNVAHGSLRLALLAGRFAYREQGLLDDTHLRFFTLESLRDMFEATGYAITSIARRRIPIDQTEIEIPANLPASVQESVRADPEATTYQFVITATATSDGNQLHAMRHALRELRPLKEEFAQQTEELASLREELEALRAAHDAVRRRMVAERLAFANHVQEIESASVKSEVVHQQAEELARHAAIVEEQRLQLETLLASRSFRYTAPMRNFFTLLRGGPRHR